MEEMQKIYCCPQASDNSALWASLMSKGAESSPADLAMLMNNGNNWMNNPWIYFVFLAMFGGGNLFGNRNGEDLSRQIQSLQNSTNSNNTNQMILGAINGNREAVGQLAQTFNCDLNSIQNAICGVKSAVERVGGEVGMSSQQVINSVLLGNKDLIQQMCSCCCENKQLVTSMGYEGQLRDQANTGAILGRLDQLSSGIQTGFAQIGYNQSQQTQTILNALNSHWTESLRDKLFEASQNAQTASIVAQLKTT